MLVATLTQIPIRTRIQMYSLSVNEENFAVAFLLLFVSFSSSFSLYDALFFLPCSHHCVVLQQNFLQILYLHHDPQTRWMGLLFLHLTLFEIRGLIPLQIQSCSLSHPSSSCASSYFCAFCASYFSFVVFHCHP